MTSGLHVPGRRPRLEDVASLVGVSPASASLVLRNAPGPSAETRRRVLAAAEQLEYRADRTASLLARRRTRMLGVMMDVTSPFHAQLIEYLHEASERVGYDLVLSTVTRVRLEERAIETLLDYRCEALLLLAPEAGAKRLTVLARRLPVVVVGRRVRATGVDVIRSSDSEGVGQAVDHLVELGHSGIAFVDGGRGTIAADRRRGYEAAMRRHCLDDQQLSFAGDHTEKAGSAAARTMLARSQRPTAVIAFNDPCALGFLDTVTRAGVEVPRDLSVVGYNDTPLARLAHINLTTVNQNAAQQAEHAVAAAVERLDGGRTRAREVVLTPHLVNRGTTGSAPTTASREV